MYEPQLVHNPFNLNGLKSLRANLTVQPLSRPRIKGCPISRSFSRDVGYHGCRYTLFDSPDCPDDQYLLLCGGRL
jgi:hypothetical protein